MKKKMKWLVDILFWVTLVLVVSSAVWFRFSDQTDKSIFGYRIYSVKTNSMKTNKSIGERFKGQSFEKGDLLVVQLKKSSEIKINDVITFVPSGIEDGSVYLTHRVKSKNEEKNTFVTRGDANNMDDPEISGKQIIGVVKFAIPFVGTFLVMIQENPYLALGLTVALLLSLSLISKFFFSKA